jgi:hypothetical protein
MGPRIYTDPVESYCKRSADGTAAELMHRYPRLSAVDVCQIPSHERALVLNWARYPRFYPPGAQLVHVPAALLYLAGVSLSTVNELLEWQYVLTGFVLLAILFKHATLLFPPAPRVLAYAVIGLNGIHVTRWALDGFYDCTSLLFLALSTIAILERRWAMGLLHWSAAFFFHYRALWYAPLAVYAAIALLRERQLSSSAPRLIAAAGMAATAALTLWASYPALAQMDINNRWHWAFGHLSSVKALRSVEIAGALMLVCLANRNWLRFAALLSLGTFLFSVHEVRPWHSLFLWPLLYIGGSTGSPSAWRRWFEVAIALALVAHVGRMQFEQSQIRLDELIHNIR